MDKTSEKMTFAERRDAAAADLEAIAKIFSVLAAEVKEGDLGAIKRFFCDPDDSGEITKYQRCVEMFLFRLVMREHQDG